MTRATLERSRSDPAAVYESPMALAVDGRLSIAERLEMLRRWDYDVREQLVASSEGMPCSTCDADLQDIARAIEELEAGESSASTATPTQHGALRDAPSHSQGGMQRRAEVPYDEIPLRARPGHGPGPQRRVPASVLSVFARLAGFGALVVTAAILKAPLVAVVGLVALSLLIVFAPRGRRL